MAITEDERHRLYQRLEGLLGRDEATTLMEHLPPVGWADVATKRDLDQLAASTKHEIEKMGNVLRLEFAHAQNRMLLAMMALVTTLVTLVFAAARFT